MTSREDRSLAPSTENALRALEVSVKVLEQAWAEYTRRWPYNADCARPEGVQFTLCGHADGTMTATVDAGPVDDLILVERLVERVGSYTAAA